MKIKQGDAYDIHIKLTDGEGSLVSVDNSAELVEFMLGRLRKTCPGEVEETTTKQWTGEGTFVLLTTEEYPANPAVRGTGIENKFSAGDVVDVILDDPSSVPYMTRSLWSLKVVGEYYNDGMDANYVVFSTEAIGAFGPYSSFTQNMTIRSTEYVLPLSQQETFSLEGVVPFEARVKFADSQVVGTSLGAVVVEHSMSREVL